LQGAIAYIRAVLATGDQAAIRQVLRSGSAYDVAITFRMRGLVLRTDNADARGMMLDAAYYAERIMRAARTIAVNAQIPMVLEAGIPAGLSGGATDPSEPPSLTDYPAPPKGSIGPVQAVLGTAFGIAMGVAGAWAWAKVKG
jgi:hypothetical protein